MGSDPGAVWVALAEQVDDIPSNCDGAATTSGGPRGNALTAIRSRCGLEAMSCTRMPRRTARKNDIELLGRKQLILSGSCSDAERTKLVLHKGLPQPALGLFLFKFVRRGASSMSYLPRVSATSSTHPTTCRVKQGHDPSAHTPCLHTHTHTTHKRMVEQRKRGIDLPARAPPLKDPRVEGASLRAPRAFCEVSVAGICSICAAHPRTPTIELAATVTNLNKRSREGMSHPEQAANQITKDMRTSALLENLKAQDAAWRRCCTCGLGLGAPSPD